MHLAKTTTTAFCALAAIPSTLGLTLKTDDASIGYFRYGPTEDAWRVCRPGEAHCARNHQSTSHRTSTRGAFIEFMTIAKRIEYVGRVSPPPSPSSSSQSTTSRIEVSIDDQTETVLLASTPIEGDSRVLWSKTFDDQAEGEGKESILRVVRITNVDGGELELDYVAETMPMPTFNEKPHPLRIKPDFK